MHVLCRLAGVVYMGVLSLCDTHRLITESFALVNSSLSEGIATAVLEVLHLSAVKLISFMFDWILNLFYSRIWIQSGNGAWLDIVQAMDLGVPVIARNIPGNTAVITDMQTGLIYDTPQVRSHASLTCAINHSWKMLHFIFSMVSVCDLTSLAICLSDPGLNITQYDFINLRCSIIW